MNLLYVHEAILEHDFMMLQNHRRSTYEFTPESRVAQVLIDFT